MGRWIALAAGVTLTVATLSGCGGDAVDASCAVTDLTHEVEHIVGESLLEVTSVDQLRCSGDWALVTATVGGGVDPPTAETMVFRRVNDMWVLKSPELVCDPGAGDEAITGDLVDAVCAGS